MVRAPIDLPIHLTYSLEWPHKRMYWMDTGSVVAWFVGYYDSVLTSASFCVEWDERRITNN